MQTELTEPLGYAKGDRRGKHISTRQSETKDGGFYANDGLWKALWLG
ncbi:MAG: hypothetical protein LBH14_06165 [Desulfobulbaceae bacterium]|jgi:hypothetical protein|nr:hypothetical protein [Desulfobulbaceae bacterium]